jgi:putative ABC transport system permease protein
MVSLRPLLRLGLRDLIRRPWQTGLMILGIALGVAVVISIDLANASAERAFALSSQAVVGSATYQILGGPSGIPDDLYRQIRLDWGIQEAAPVVTGTAIAVDLGDLPLTVLGIDPFAEAPFGGWLTTQSIAQPGFQQFFLDPQGVVISDSFAPANGIRLGDGLRVQVGDRLVRLRVIGILHLPDARQQLATNSLLFMDIGSAQALLGMDRRLSRVDLLVDQPQADWIAQRLPSGFSVRPASEQSQTTQQLAAAFQLNLTALSLLALVVGMFLIYNTIMFAVVQRRTILGILRALGVSRTQVVLMVLAEAGAVSAIGAVGGIGLGWLLAQGALSLITQTINDFYFVVNVREAALQLPAIGTGLALGVGAGILAAVGPAVEAASAPAITAIQRSSLETRVRRMLPGVTAAGLGLALAGAICLVLVTQSLVLNFAGIFLILLGISLLVPAATAISMGLAARGAARPLGTLGRMAARTVAHALSRSSVAIAALMVALSVTIGVGLMISSFRSTVVNWLDLTLRADLYVSAPSSSGARPEASLPAELATRLAQIPSVDRVEGFRAVSVDSQFGPIDLSVVDGRRERAAGLYRFAQGSPEEVWQQVLGGAVIVSEAFAYRHGISGAASLRLLGDRGWQVFRVVGIYYDYSTDRGTVLMTSDVYHRYWEDTALSSLGIFVKPGASLSQVAEELRASLAGTGLQVQENAVLRAEALRIFDRTFAITNALRILAVIVAFIGVLSAILALQLERGRELATLRALGLTPGGLWRLTLSESVLMGLIAGVLSLPTGALLAWLLIHVINLRSFGWTIQWQGSPQVFLEALLLGVVAALLAAVYPALRQSRLSVAEGLRGE